MYVSLVTLIAFTSFALWTTRSATLEFRELTSPKGFRELVILSQASGIDPLVGASREIGTRLDEREICDGLFHDPLSPRVGNEHSKVSIAAFFDYRCPYCKELTRILAPMQSNGSVRVIYKEWPILGGNSVLAARAALAAARQGRYLEFHTRLMNSPFIPTQPYTDAVAAELGMNQTRLIEDMSASDTTAEIHRTANLAAEFGFLGTPALVVGRTIVQGAITRAQLESLIEDERSSDLPPIC